MDFVERLRKWGKDNDYEEMQLHFTRARDERNMSPRMETDLDEAEDVVYSQIIPIDDFSKPLDDVRSRSTRSARQNASRL